MAHAAARRGGAAGDEADHRLLAAALGLVAQELGGVFLGRAADLADHDDRLGLGVGQEHLQHVDEFGALDRVAADADRGGLAEAFTAWSGTRPRRSACRSARRCRPMPGLKMLPGMMPILHSPGVSTPGQFGPIRRDLRAGQRALHPHHVEHRNAFGDADDQRDLGVDRFADRVGRARRRHVDHAGVGAGLARALRRRCRTPAGRDASSRPCPAWCRRPSWCRRRSPARNGRCRSCR